MKLLNLIRRIGKVACTSLIVVVSIIKVVDVFTGIKTHDKKPQENEDPPYSHFNYIGLPTNPASVIATLSGSMSPSVSPSEPPHY